jgi:L-threonylcarbamoyladenylate synthase
VPEKAKILAKKFWPGQITMVFAKVDYVSYSIIGGQEAVAIRIPNQKLTLEISKKMGTGVAAPLANRFSRVNPTLSAHVFEELDGLIDGVVEGGQCEVGIESTIIDLSTEAFRLLRPVRIRLGTFKLLKYQLTRIK